jgi:phage terminase Nu1 subunit (DNA packaging protein)
MADGGPISRAALPDGVDDASVNKGDLAAAFSVSETTVDRWIRDGAPVIERGANGRAYAFQLSDVWAWREGLRETEDADKARREKSVGQMRLALANRGDDLGFASMSPKDQQAIYQTERLYMATAQERRELIPAADALAMLDTIFALVRDALDAQPDRAAAALGLTGAQVEALVGVNDATLREVQARIRQAFNPLGGLAP